MYFKFPSMQGTMCLESQSLLVPGEHPQKAALLLLMRAVAREGGVSLSWNDSLRQWKLWKGTMSHEWGSSGSEGIL